MSREKFREQVDRYFRQEMQHENGSWVREAVLSLYDLVSSKARQVDKEIPGSPQWCRCLYETKNIIDWTPLCYFQYALIDHESFAIRVGVKGIINRDASLYRNDPEATLMARIDKLLESTRLAAKYEDELLRNLVIQKALKIWMISFGFHHPFLLQLLLGTWPAKH